ncbi:hypothetical protein MPDQ_008099 [Monascus purpureus]|uniref:Alpha-ketoglutarate-dependent dioxygenase AlkB-like domain-containing protein n=1 Tax=Monascus purpureus TaxID=5098 RepID=A0A507QSY0_MONPU|nr:hypothetical protein MPDQ_008099 [Monascus purpureus]
MPDVTGTTLGQPPAWAEWRPALCDAIPWFRAQQGGMYRHGGICLGFLIDADGGDRSYVDEETVITRVGGGHCRDSQGNLVATKDQDDAGFLKSLINSMNLKVAVGLVIGSGCEALLGRKLPHRYNVMAYFRVADYWHEKVNGKTVAKVRFEKLDLSEKSWWAAEDSPPPVPVHQRDFTRRPQIFQCQQCLKPSKRVYNECWICLNPGCPHFWDRGPIAIPDDLTFHPDFLSCRLQPDPEIEPQHSLVPNLLATFDEGDTESSFLRIAWKGIVCPLCLKCIQRKYWRGWKCADNPNRDIKDCPFEHIVEIRPISLRAVIDDFGLGTIKRAISFEERYDKPALIDDRLFQPYRIFVYDLPGFGSITHLVSNININSRPGGPNDLFRQLQTLDLGLRRYPLGQSVVAGMLTAQFVGTPYKYIVSVDSRAFSDAPDEIMRILGRLTWATERVVGLTGDQVLLPNELLAMGYLDGMKISYHDDGEESLGPTIASLSLGAKADMKFRMKAKYYHGYTKSKNNLLADDPVLPNCHNEEHRRSLKADFEAGKIDQEKYNEERRKLPISKSREASAMIKLELNHGDIVVMHGENLQKYYEPEYIDDKDRHKGIFRLTPEQIYDGQ